MEVAAIQSLKSLPKFCCSRREYFKLCFTQNIHLDNFPQISFITGVEPFEGMRKLTGKIARNILGIKKSKKIRNVNGSFEESPAIVSESADAIISNEAFQHVKEPETALRNMASKLKPNRGMVIVYRPNYKTNPPNPNQITTMFKMLLYFKT